MFTGMCDRVVFLTHQHLNNAQSLNTSSEIQKFLKKNRSFIRFFQRPIRIRSVYMSPEWHTNIINVAQSIFIFGISPALKITLATESWTVFQGRDGKPAGDGFLVVYSVTDRSSFRYAQTCLQELRPAKRQNVVILVANKNDLVRNRIISETGDDARMH